MPTPNTPKVFISYSWTSPEHEAKVLKLCEDLMSESVDVVFDKWHLHDGHDANAFMEKMVNDPEISKVIIICDRKYQQKANKRSGGVGTEAQILSAELYSSKEQDKFVAVIFEKDEEGAACTPTYYSSRIYIDFTNPDQEAMQFERLVRWAYDKPIHIPPPLGKTPSYILDDIKSITLPTSVKYKKALDAIRNNKPYYKASLTEFLDEIVIGLEKFRPDTKADHIDDAIISSISDFLPYRNELLSIFEALALYAPDSTFTSELHTFFERIYVYTYRPKSITKCSDWDWDGYKFILHELFLYAISTLIKRNRFSEAGKLINGKYLVSTEHGEVTLEYVSAFPQHIPSIGHRNKRLNNRRLSLHADLLEERCKGMSISFTEIMQADFTIYVSQLIHNHEPNDLWLPWFPISVIFSAFEATSFELYLRGETNEGFENLKMVLGIKNKAPLDAFIQLISADSNKVPKYEYRQLAVKKLLNYEKLDAHK